MFRMIAVTITLSVLTILSNQRYIPAAVTVTSLQNLSGFMIGRLSVNAEQPNAGLTTTGDPPVDANRVIFPP